MARNALQGSIAAYNDAVAGGNVTLLPTYPRFVCPAVCFNANGLAFISVRFRAGAGAWVLAAVAADSSASCIITIGSCIQFAACPWAWRQPGRHATHCRPVAPFVFCFHSLIRASGTATCASVTTGQ